MRDRPLAGERRHRRGLGRCHLGGDLVLGSRALQFLELQLHLIEKPCGALRARPIELARQLLDLQLQMGDQGLVVGGLGSGHREFCFGVDRPGCLDDSLIARGNQRCLQRFDVIWKGFTTRIHALIKS